MRIPVLWTPRITSITRRSLKGLTDDEKACITATDGDARAALMSKAISALKGSSVFIKFVTEAAGGNPSSDALLGAIWTQHRLVSAYE